MAVDFVSVVRGAGPIRWWAGDGNESLSGVSGCWVCFRWGKWLKRAGWCLHVRDRRVRAGVSVCVV